MRVTCRKTVGDFSEKCTAFTPGVAWRRLRRGSNRLLLLRLQRDVHGAREPAAIDLPLAA